MAEKPPISVHILTFNSAATLRRALTSVRDCAEILLIDGGSTDDTLVIGQEYGARTIEQRSPNEQGKPLGDFAAARNRGLAHTTQPWILVLDSDEVISPALWEEIASIAHQTQPAAYLLPRRYVESDGTVIAHASTYPNEHLYFFHRDAVVQWIKPVHERVELKEGTPVYHLKGASLAPMPTIEEFKTKNLQYIRIEALRSHGCSWGHWLRHRVLHTLRSRLIALVRILWIWLLPHQGKRLPLTHEFLRFWYGWKLVVATCPLSHTEPRP
ncbi:hypothetical protein COU80_05300 [Candidatus Peregrinibacteria bacterium CG10_big_fil_rev_8_21_14_0_10_55_24]|nr:MAG: hypothetical protein COU80_05300 [Candidatus Peregrinibacteria bacterium CG10_big_fil_rev_8_21_14_0_10_55_24]